MPKVLLNSMETATHFDIKPDVEEAFEMLLAIEMLYQSLANLPLLSRGIISLIVKHTMPSRNLLCEGSKATKRQNYIKWAPNVEHCQYLSKHHEPGSTYIHDKRRQRIHLCTR